MEGMSTWWAELAVLARWFYIVAAFFSVFFIWQLIMAIIGLGGGEADLDTHVDAGDHVSPDDMHETVTAFKLLSFRSILAFFTLFAWAGALYLERQVPTGRAMTYAAMWGIAAMAIVSLVLFLMRRMSETGNIRIETTVGVNGTVYLDIPANGEGEVRVLCSGVITHFKARNAGGAPLKGGTPVRVTKVLGPNTIEVEQLK
jgi:hypothetical protein